MNSDPLGPYFTYLIQGSGLPPTFPTAYATQVYTGPRPNPNFGAIYELGNGVSSWYDGLVASLEKRFSHGLQGNVSYTWSHEIDDDQGQGSSSSNIFGFSDSNWTYNGDYGFDKGSGLLDQRQAVDGDLRVGAQLRALR